ncbi:DUF4256 domain-containing protein [Christiangramia sp. SM2212]|uniref:DUF4256 domain-containing protein n=1 Tax=Christiangramia sediminicola TaxID=3073267 RepID=A0ABU1ELL9_9FLAO|nr:DUF4256 domain-containing protein [Christiangramia sp. SM2212]MDR5589229.1 DUF4256 domain-containing protein [Christiangramia sp. SM2212]
MELSTVEREEIKNILRERFEANMHRHKNLSWKTIESRLNEDPDKLNTLFQMEETGGEPDVVGFALDGENISFVDCSAESPKSRRSYCYDHAALESRKKHKPVNSALTVANEMGVELLDEIQYRQLQELGNFDSKTSSWLKTPNEIRELGGALFGDFRYNHVFIYHNGAESYYAARGFRGILVL